MHHPLESIQARQRRPFFALLLILTLMVIIGMQAVSGPLTTAAAPSGIVSYELAGGVATARAILDSWDAGVRVRVGLNLGLDYLFLVLYSTSIACACAWIAGALRERLRPLASVGALLAWGGWLAALLDAVENGALLTMLLDAPAQPWPGVAWWCAVVKFALVLLGLLFVLVGGASLVLTPKRGSS
jgi:hypothetical protein